MKNQKNMENLHRKIGVRIKKPVRKIGTKSVPKPPERLLLH